MGKKNKKINKTPDLQVLVANEGTNEQDGTNLTKFAESKEIFNNTEITDNNSSDRMNTKKKKRKHASADVVNDTSVQSAIIDERIQAVEDELDESSSLDNKKKKKKKKRHITHEDGLTIENTGIEDVDNQIMDNEVDIPKEKKKKNKGNSLLEAENKNEIDQMNEESEENETKVFKKKTKKSNQLNINSVAQQINEEPVENEIILSKKKTKKSNSLNDDSVAQERCSENVSNEEKPKVTKSQKKKKTGTAVLSAEESQVAEEDIDKFCDELDEEDNKQYEDWVKLIEASLPPPHEKK